MSKVIMSMFCLFLGACSATDASLDLSYLPLDGTLGAALQQIKSAQALVPENTNQLAVVDVSSSVLGDDGLHEIATVLVGVVAQSTNKKTIDLKAQSNRLSSAGVASFLSSLINQNKTKESTEATTASDSDSSTSSRQIFRKLDLGWNRLVQDGKSNKALHKALQELLVSDQCPDSLSLECTGIGPATCRAIAKGILARFEQQGRSSSSSRTPVSLCLASNDLGDAGAAAIAAAIRTVVCSALGSVNKAASTSANAVAAAPKLRMFDTLDLSNCGIGDTGAEALALALQEAKGAGVVGKLILSNNRITDQGALSLGRTFTAGAGGAGSASESSDLHLDLSNNKITDRGVATIASAVERGLLTHVSLRSCLIHADGAELLGKALNSFATASSNSVPTKRVCVDLSGNPLGVLRGKTKDGSKYSASKLKSKASATASAYMTQGLSFLKKGLGPAFSTIESDDEEEKHGGSGESVEDDNDASNKRCGFKALANAFLRDERSDSGTVMGRSIHLGLRRTFCDTAGADALAAMLVTANYDMNGVELKLEMALNPVVEEEMIAALHGEDEHLLREMAERHTDAMDIIRQSLERAAEAASMAAARMEDDGAYDQGWDVPEVYDRDEDEWDSDADYEDQDAYSY